LKPAVADINALCLYRISDQKGRINKAKDHHTLLLEWDPYDTSIMVFNQDRPTFNRFSHSPRLSESWGISPKGTWQWLQSEAELENILLDQINGLERFLDFYRYSVLNGEGQVSEIILAGEFPNLKELGNRLKDRFMVDIKMLELPKQVDQSFGALYGLTLKEEAGEKRL